MMGTILNLAGSLIVGGYFVALGLGMKVEPAKLRGQKAFIGLGAFIILGGVALVTAQHNLANIPLGMAPKQIVEGIIAQMHPPVQIDAATRLDAVEAGDDRIIFRFSLQSADDAEFDRQIDRLRAHLLSEGCEAENNKRLLTSGIALEMNYTMMNSVRTADPIMLTPKMCGY